MGKPSPHILKETIRAQAKQLGFGLCGFTTCDPPAHRATYEAWLTAGRHGAMAYLATERARRTRADPRRLMPACQTIIVLGCLYAPPLPPTDDPLGGRVAAYALGDDYHDLLPAMARRLAESITAQVDAPLEWRAVSDTAPLLEREIGQRAGLGWIGKNGMLISPQRGSYFVLAELLISLDLPPDPPFESNRCGSCRRCLDACPTACLLPDRTLDATRCISYLTIENRGDIPEALRHGIGRWAFGCDICQEVCPWNVRFAGPAPSSPLAARRHFPLRDLRAELLADEAALAARFRRSPLRRAKRAGWMRNLIIALGNTGRPEALQALERALADADPLLRRHAAWALGQIGGTSAGRMVGEALEAETDAETRAALRHALDHLARAAAR
ncbi:MAG: tRNA epoxyqueuosine(34) reductase QueG [Chloroflexi bacterium]|nr:tRNA epoxyqueuosine(34) reductase QueG [Chloroflexota bacterium]